MRSFSELDAQRPQRERDLKGFDPIQVVVIVIIGLGILSLSSMGVARSAERVANDETIEYQFAACGGQIAYLVAWTSQHKIGKEIDRSTYDSMATWFVQHNDKLNIDKNKATRGFMAGMQSFEDNLMRYQDTPSTFLSTYYRPMILSCQRTAETLFPNDKDIAANWQILLELATKL
jgi:hypothetical protein